MHTLEFKTYATTNSSCANPPISFLSESNCFASHHINFSIPGGRKSGEIFSKKNKHYNFALQWNYRVSFFIVSQFSLAEYVYMCFSPLLYCSPHSSQSVFQHSVDYVQRPHAFFSSTVFRARFSNRFIYVIGQAHNLFFGFIFHNIVLACTFFFGFREMPISVSTGTEQTNIKESSKWIC